MGKTTIATKFPKHLLLAAEKGYNAIPGAMALPINSWSELKKVVRQLKDKKAQETYETIILDTIDLVVDFCEKYICDNYVVDKKSGEVGVEALTDIPYGKGHKLLAKELDDLLRSIVQMNYGLVMISHSVDKVFKDQNGNEYNQIVPTLDSKPRNIVSRMADIIGYSRIIEDEEGHTQPKLFLRGTPRFVAGSRFKYIPAVIDFNYESLTAAIQEAIEKESENSNKELFTEERNNLFNENEELNYDSLIGEFNKKITDLRNQYGTEAFVEKYQPKIIEITEKYLGKGGKISQCSEEQVEALSLIMMEVKELE